jgi:CHAT domain-containing protein/Tfp pilus assembly protein PilF
MLNDPQGQRVDDDDDSGRGGNALIVVTLPASGTYTVLANSYGEAETGEYRLMVRSVTAADQTAIEAEQSSQQGDQQYDISRFREALTSYQAALPLYRQIGYRLEEGVTLNNIGLVYRSLGRYEEALQQYQQALAIRREVSDRPGEGTTLNNIGSVYQSLGRYEEALQQYQPALAISREVGNRAGEGVTLNNIGEVYRSQGRYEEALQQYQQALVIRREVSDRLGEGTTLNNIGSVYKSLGRYEEALQQFQLALAIFRELGDRLGEGVTLSNIGAVYRSLGRYEEALQQYQQALAIHREVGDRPGEGVTLNNIGLVYDSLERYEEALQYYQQDLAITREVGDRPGESTTLNNIGSVYDSLGRYEEALQQYQQALAITREVGDRPGEGTILNNIGYVYQSLGRYEEALQQYQPALAIHREVGNRPMEGTTLNNIGYVLEAQKQTELAIVFLKQSVNEFEKIRNDIRGLSIEEQQSYTDTIAKVYRKLADLLLSQNRIFEAQQVLDLLKVQELEEYLKDVRGNEQTPQGLPHREAEREIEQPLDAILENAILLGKELTQLSQIPLEQRTSAQTDRIRQLRQQQQVFTQQYLDFLASPQVQKIIARLRRNTSGQSLDLENLTALQDNLRQLQQDAVLLYPFVLDDRLELVLVTADAPPVRRTVPIDQTTLNRDIVALRHALNDPNQDALAPAQALYRSLIQPIETDLQQAGAKTIIYAPDGALRYIPLATLHDGQQWLVQRFRTNNITAVSLTELNTQPRNNPTVFIGAFTEGNYAIPVENQVQNFSGLEFARREAENLAALIPNHLARWNQAFSPETVLDMNDYRIVHLATHATFVPTSPDDSFILFGNGKPVTLRDIKLWRLDNVDLVVLSACETGLGDELGDGREILGLGFQIQRTGARAALASLWQVSDGGTQMLMDAFYAALNQGMTKAEALRQAQIALITGDLTAVGGIRGEARINVVSTATGLPANVSNNLDHPYYWAPFILIGNGL